MFLPLSFINLQGAIMESLAVRVVKASSRGASGNSLAMLAEETETVQLQSITETDVNTAASRNAWPWECDLNVSNAKWKAILSPCRCNIMIFTIVL